MDNQNSIKSIPEEEKNTENIQEVTTGNSNNNESERYRKIRNKRTMKKQILNRLSVSDFDDFDNFLDNPSQWADYDPTEIVKLINDIARKSQAAAETENKHLDLYHRLANLLAPSKDTPVSCQPKNELALALNAIAHLEPNPPPMTNVAQLDTIYHRMATLMNPTLPSATNQELDVVGVNFIREAINEVMTEVEGPQGKDDLKKLQDLLMADKYDAFTQDQAMELKMIFSDETFNPLKMPMEFMINKPFFDRSS